MSVWLFIIIKTVNVKVVSWLQCVPFFGVLHRRRGEIILWLKQRNIFVLGMILRNLIIIIHVSDVELALRNITFPQNCIFWHFRNYYLVLIKCNCAFPVGHFSFCQFHLRALVMAIKCVVIATWIYLIWFHYKNEVNIFPPQNFFFPRIIPLWGVIYVIYEVCSTIIFPGSRVSDFAGNLHAQKLNKSQTNQADVTGVQYFFGICYFSLINRSGVKFLFFCHLSSSSKFAPA